MNLRLAPLNARDRERTLWLLAACMLVGGYFVTTQRYERQIAASTHRAQMLYDKANLNRRVISQRAKAQTLRRELRSYLDGVLFAPKRSLVTAMLLRDLDTLARRHGTEIAAISPQTNPKDSPTSVAASPLPGTRPEADSLQDEIFDISARGRFSDLLGFIAQLPRQHVLLRVSQVNFSLHGSPKADTNAPVLDAKIHALVYRLAKPNVLGEL